MYSTIFPSIVNTSIFLLHYYKKYCFLDLFKYTLAYFYFFRIKIEEDHYYQFTLYFN
jgi:hypothetical protein